MEFINEYGLFLLKIFTVVIAILLVIAFSKGDDEKGSLSVRSLNEEYNENVELIEEVALSKKEKKELEKSRKNDETEGTERTFVLDFEGSVDAKEVDSLREEITSILAVAKEGDEVLLRLESGGGLVSAYGLAASQLERIKDAGIGLVVSVDKVAASGGYMMACVADKIIAAPFSLVGSVGVIAQIPNFNKVLKKHGVDFEMHTAGEHKRTLTMFGENTEEGRLKFKCELDDTHNLFISHVERLRPSLRGVEFATGECWYGTQAKDNLLVDEIGTSDDYIVSAMGSRNVIHVSYKMKKTLSQKLAEISANSVDAVFTKVLEKGRKPIV